MLWTARFSLTCLVLVAGLAAGRTTLAADGPPTPEQIEFFERHVRPVFVEHCHKCHADKQQKGGLRLDSRAAVLTGGDSGPAIAVEKPVESELLKAINYDPDGYQMPPTGKLPAETIAKLTEWVRMGAPWPEEKGSPADKLGPTSAEEFSKRSSYWSFQPLQRVTPPAVQDNSWPRTTIDRFLLQRLEEAKLTPAAEADRRTWLRRATFYTTGLPPTREEIDAFLADASPDAFERVVDRLLASPHFGERWGRHWLDLARYAESRGHEFDYDVANPWHYRDYVVRAMNEDIRYDRFVIEQVAGDLLPAPGTAPAGFPARLDPLTGANESLVATGFWLMGEWVHSPVDIRKEESERFDNMIDVYGKTFLGLTIACARCHDHKFDPISQKDYYALAGYLQSCSYSQRPFETIVRNESLRDELRQLDDLAGPKVTGLLAEQSRPVTDRLDDYLLAARNVLSAQPDALETSAGETDSLAAAAVIAGERMKLDPDLLRKWCVHLKGAQNDRTDPFFAWARFACGKTKAPSQLADDARRQVAAPTAAAGTGRIPLIAEDGVCFALAEKDESGGRIWLSRDPEQPVAQVAIPGRTTLDPDFSVAAAAPGTMGEPGAIGRVPRGGRTLRTATFEITHDRIYCRVRGDCRTYLAVDSHITLNGPLHGVLYRDQKPEAGWRWIEHDLSRYRGHRAHLELIVPAGADFAVGEICQGNEPPWNGPVEPGSLAAATASALVPESRPVPTGPVTAAAVAAQLKDCCQPGTKPDAGLAEWITQHAALFGLDRPASRTALRQATAEIIARRGAIASQVGATSHLAPCLLDGNGEDEALHIRGNSAKLGPTVPRRFLGVFHGSEPATADPASSGDSGSGRLALAREMVDPRRTPVLPRVIVNRLWHHAFGRGLVPTVDDFGHMGQPPSHPELLDWLSNELLRNDWSLKPLHREILLSATFRMESRDRPGQEARVTEVDPQNILLHRMNVLRLEGESIRDSVLALSGRLDDRLYGPSVPIHLTSFLEGRGRPGASGPVDGGGRRSLYLSVRRNFLEPLLVAFDFPTPHTTIGRRSVSNVPAQALALLNNPLVQEQTKIWGGRLVASTPGASVSKRIQLLSEASFGRLPTAEEERQGVEFVEALRQDLGCSPDDPRLWGEYCHVLVNVKEFTFIP